MTLGGIDGTTTSSLRLLNARTVLHVLRANPPSMTIGQLAEATGLTRPTVEGAVDELRRLDLAAPAPPPATQSGAGRPGRRFRFHVESGFAAGVDLRPDRLRIEVVDLGGGTVARSFRSGMRLKDPEVAVDAVRDELARVFADFALDASRLQAVSLSVPGVVDSSGRLWKSIVVPEWVDADLPRLLTDRVPGSPSVVVDNAANHAAIAETRDRTPVSSMVFVLVDEGLGTAATIDSRLVRGHRGGAGEVGTLDLLRWKTASARLLQHVPTLDSVRDYPSSHGRARDALRAFASDIAVGTAAMVLAFDPELVVIGGIVGLADESFLDLVRADLDDLCLYPPRVARAASGEHAVVRGASLHALESVESLRFP